LQFENGVWLCGDPAVAGVKDDFLDTQRQCQEIFLQDCQSVPLFSRLLCTVYRIFSPLF
jgi:cardiolipin synthase